MISQRGNIIFFIGFIFLGYWVYLDKFKHTLSDGKSLTGYLIGCAILIIGLILNKKDK